MAVYFIEAVGTDTVKIGVTAGDPEDRLKQLQTGCPHKLRLRVAIHGDLRLEQWLHQQFDHLCIGGEWFRLTAEVEAYIATSLFLGPRLDEIDRRLSDLEKWFAIVDEHRLKLARDAHHIKCAVAELEAEVSPGRFGGWFGHYDPATGKHS